MRVAIGEKMKGNIENRSSRSISINIQLIFSRDFCLSFLRTHFKMLYKIVILYASDCLQRDQWTKSGFEKQKQKCGWIWGGGVRVNKS